MAKQAYLGLFIKSQLYFPDKIPLQRYRVLSGYTLWQNYKTFQEKKSRKGMTYQNFLRYLYILKTLGLIVEVRHTHEELSEEGEKNLVETIHYPNIPKKHDYVPIAWEKKQLKADKEMINSEYWSNPGYYYHRRIGRIVVESGKEKRTVKQSEEGIQRKVELSSDMVTIKISRLLKEYIDMKRKKGTINEKTINGYLTEIVMNLPATN